MELTERQVTANEVEPLSFKVASQLHMQEMQKKLLIFWVLYVIWLMSKAFLEVSCLQG